MSTCSHQRSITFILITTPTIPHHLSPSPATSYTSAMTYDISTHTQDSQNTTADTPHHPTNMQCTNMTKRPPRGQKHAKWSSRGPGGGTGKHKKGTGGTPAIFYFILTILLTITNSTHASLCTKHQDTPIWACLCVWHPSPPVRHQTQRNTKTVFSPCLVPPPFCPMRQTCPVWHVRHVGHPPLYSNT